LIYIFTHQVWTHRLPPFADPLQNQHQLIGLIVGLGATIELTRRWLQAGSEGWKLAWPLTVIVVGIAFLVHEQGTVEALVTHWALAGSLVLSGLTELAALVGREQGTALFLLATFIFAGAAFQLIFYRERPGAHGAHGGNSSQSPAHSRH
jgi:hypothetical protein